MPTYQNQLLSDEILGPDQSLMSFNQRYTFIYQSDGNLVLYKNYRNQDRRALWASGTNGSPIGSCIMQVDGNLVIYDSNWQYVWDTATYGNSNSYLIVQDDGNVVIYRRPDNTFVWATNTVQPIIPTGVTAQGEDIQPGEVLASNQSIGSLNGQYTLFFQEDGNLVLYRNWDGRALWDSGTYGRSAEVCTMQGDGNMVIYDLDGQYVWDTATYGNSGSRLVVQDDGNVVIYRPDNTPIWATNTVQPTDLAATGEWIVQAATLGFAGVHAALLHTGRVLFFSYDPEQENTLERGFWELWEPDQGPSGVRVHDRNFFCAGHCFLADGRLLVSGGQSYNWFPFVKEGADHDVHTFDPVSETWTRHERMPGARWYPTCVVLPNGDGLMAGGHATRFRPTGAINDEYELFSWQTNQKSKPRRFNPGHIDAYPFLAVLPDGSGSGTLFAFSRNEARLFSLEEQTWNPTIFQTHSCYWRTYNKQGAFVVLPLLPDEPERVRVMVIGGGGADGKATSSAELFEFNRASPSDSRWRCPTGGDMRFRRFMSDALLLPDGTVLVVNGAGAGHADESQDPVMAAEIFDPRDESWHLVASINRPRMYHSAALLLPDARVVVSGNTEHWNKNNKVEERTLEVFNPPYLFKGARPVIQSAPAEIFYAGEIQITVSGSVASIAILRAGSTTHTNNMDQRYAGLAIVRRTGDQLTVRTPSNGTVAPPGFYMLFAVSETGVPSIAKFVRLF